MRHVSHGILAIVALPLIVAACGGGESPNPVNAAAYNDGWYKGVAYVVCEMSNGNNCFNDLWLSDGAGQGPAAHSNDPNERAAYFKGHSDGSGHATSCLETVLKSMPGDIWDSVQIEGVGMDFDRAVTAFRVSASQSDWDTHGQCVSETHDNPYG